MVYQLTRSGRKSLSISVGKDGSIQVKAPNWLPRSQIEEFLQKKEGWIRERQREARALEKKRARHTFQDGDVFYFRGEPYCLKTGQADGTGPGEGAVSLLDREKVLAVAAKEAEDVKASLEQWYVGQARRIFSERCRHYYPLAAQAAWDLGRKEARAPGRIAVRSQKTRWGSCSAKGNLNFNWRLLFAPAGALDYVVAHELCHLVYLDHSREFWQLVERVCPESGAWREWLKENGPLLEWES